MIKVYGKNVSAQYTFIEQSVNKRLYRFRIAAEISKLFGCAFKLIYHLNEPFGIYARLNVEIEHKFKIPVGKRTAFKLDYVNIKRIEH